MVKRHIFLVEILGMTNYCNLNCDYCDWEKYPFRLIGRKEIAKAKKHLQETRVLIRKHFPYAQMIEYSGGEPYVYPEIVELVLSTFPEYWLRIVTNGLLLTEEDILLLKKHGKVFLAVSLDGETIEKNKNRFQDEDKLKRIFANIDRMLSEEIPVMILCTMNRDNIDGFLEYLQYLTVRWTDAIEKGLLVLPAHWLDEYHVRHRKASEEQIFRLSKKMENLELPIYTRIYEHYQAMFKSIRSCSVYRWSASIHFIKDELISDGKFTVYQCGMRGIGFIGNFFVDKELEEDTFSSIYQKTCEINFQAFRCNCFVDWNVFDLIFQGWIPIERAKKWFIIFRDANICKWIADYRKILAEEAAALDMPGKLFCQREEGKMGFDKAFFKENIDAVIFDLYGTLLENHTRIMERPQWETMAQFLGYHGALYQIEELAECFTRLVIDTRKQCGQEENPEKEFDEAVVFHKLYQNKGIIADVDLIQITAQVFRACSTSYCRPYPGAKELIEALRAAGKRIYLLSNAQRVYTEAELKMNKMNTWFDGIRLSSDLGWKKPSQKFFMELVDFIGVSPERILMVGNDAVDDILPARRLLMYTCYIHSNLSRAEEIPPCTLYLEGDALLQLKKMLLG